MTSTSLTPESTASAPEKPVILSVLPDFPIASQQCALHLQQHIDLMLLALESLEVGAGEALLALCKELGLDKIVKLSVSSMELFQDFIFRQFSPPYLAFRNIRELDFLL
jgi:indole-3-glycerol phosphate synthase